MTVPIGSPYARLAPSSLVPPDDPSRADGAAKRTLRDRFVDTFLFLLALVAGAFFFGSMFQRRLGSIPDHVVYLDISLCVASSVMLWGRRRRPLVVAVVITVASMMSASAGPAGIVALFTVAVHRRTSVALAVVALNLISSVAFVIVRPTTSGFWFSIAETVVLVVTVTAWGMFVRARRQLIWTLRERAERAEAEQRLLADRARDAERARIAREMHDVLGHRISLLALHAGGLQVRPDLPPDQVRQTAGLLRETAHQALQELRGVIGVLREGIPGGDGVTTDRAPAPPQPSLRDVTTLVEETRKAGAKVYLDLELTPGAENIEPPGTVGRDAYRIVQEALTNVAKHAQGTSTSVHVSGGPGCGLRVLVRNRMPMASALLRPGTSLPGAGTGLLGLRERVSLTGGSIEHGPDGAGHFVVDAKLAWRREGDAT